MEKRILTAITIVFFIVMLAFTFISRKTAVELLPQVEAVYAEDGVTFPATAVYTDQWGNSFVYAIMEEKSILGTVEVAHKINIEIREERGEEITCDGAENTSHLPYIKDVSVGISDGDRVRRADDGRA